MFSRFELTHKKSSYAPISFSHGLIHKQLITNLPKSHKLWDEIAFHLADELGCFRIQDTLKRMPVLSADVAVLPDTFLLRASIILSSFAHAYYYTTRGLQLDSAPLPEAVSKPLLQIAQRINKKININGNDETYVGRTYLEDFVGNWQFLNNMENSMEVELDRIQVGKLKLLVSYFNLPDDDIASLVTGPLTQARFAPAIKNIAMIDEELDKEAPSIDLLNTYINTINSVLASTEVAFDAMTPKLSLKKPHVDPVIWGQTSPSMGKIHPHGMANSGADSVIFHVMDRLIGRSLYTSPMGKNAMNRVSGLPRNYQQLIFETERVGNKLHQFVVKSQTKALTDSFSNLVQRFAAPNGLLDKHRKKAYGYLIPMFAAGRLFTNGLSKGQSERDEQKAATTPWGRLNAHWIEGMNERLSVLKPLGIDYILPNRCVEPVPLPIDALSPYSVLDVISSNKVTDKKAIYRGKAYDLKGLQLFTQEDIV